MQWFLLIWFGGFFVFIRKIARNKKTKWGSPRLKIDVIIATSVCTSVYLFIYTYLVLISTMYNTSHFIEWPPTNLDILFQYFITTCFSNKLFSFILLRSHFSGFQYCMHNIIDNIKGSFWSYDWLIWYVR